MIETSRGELATLSRVFSPAVVKELGKRGSSPLLARLLCESSIPDRLPENATLFDAFDMSYSLLKQMGNRDDYVYRSAIVQKIVLGKHSLKTCTLLHEVRSGKSKADLVVLNGVSTAYEIKSERDSLKRLPSQLQDYRETFAVVNVVTNPEQAEAILSIAPSDVGVIVLSSRFNLRVVREAQNVPERTSPLMMLSTLRVAEAVEVLQQLGVSFPEVPNTERWATLRECFEPLSPIEVQQAFTKVLKESRSSADSQDWIRDVPKPLRAAFLEAGKNPAIRKKLIETSNVSISDVLDWR